MPLSMSDGNNSPIISPVCAAGRIDDIRQFARVRSVRAIQYAVDVQKITFMTLLTPKRDGRSAPSYGCGACRAPAISSAQVEAAVVHHPRLRPTAANLWRVNRGYGNGRPGYHVRVRHQPQGCHGARPGRTRPHCRHAPTRSSNDLKRFACVTRKRKMEAVELCCDAWLYCRKCSNSFGAGGKARFAACLLSARQLRGSREWVARFCGNRRAPHYFRVQARSCRPSACHNSKLSLVCPSGLKAANEAANPDHPDPRPGSEALDGADLYADERASLELAYPVSAAHP